MKSVNFIGLLIFVVGSGLTGALLYHYHSSQGFGIWEGILCFGGGILLEGLVILPYRAGLLCILYDRLKGKQSERRNDEEA
jgi:hypothetical protein